MAATDRSAFSAGRLALADARLGLAVLNYARVRGLERAFGINRQQANLLTFVLALGAAEASVELARRMWHAPFGLSGEEWAAGGLVLRECAFGIAGPAAREVPGAGTLLTVAMLGTVGLPTLRRSVKAMRELERRVRIERQGQYAAARRALSLRRRTPSASPE
jgi:hypothetical protein